MTQRSEADVRVRSGAARERPETDSRTMSASTDAVDESLKTRTMDEAPVGITIADATKPDMPLVYANAAFERITGYAPEYAVGRNCRFLQGEATRAKPVAQMRAAIEDGQATTVVLRNYRKSGELFWNEVTIAPLYDGTGKVAYYVGFQQDVTRRKRAEQAAADRAERIERERTAQQHLLERLDGIVAEVTDAVTQSQSRSDLQREAVQAIGEVYAGAWFGAYDPSIEAVEPDEVVGETDVPQGSRFVVGDVAAMGGGDGDVGDGAESRDPVERAVAGALAERHVRIESLDGGTEAALTSVAAVPLHYGEATYGVVCVYVRNDGFDDHERAILAALGRTLATGINAHETQRTLQTQETVELRLALGDHPLAGFATDLQSQLQYAGSVGDKDRPTMLFEVAEPTAQLDEEAVHGAAAERDDIEVDTVLAETTCGPVIELAVTDPTLQELLTAHSGELRAAVIEPGIARVTVEVGREALAQSLAAAAMERFESAEVISYCRRETRDDTGQGFVAELESELTDRQHAAFLRAYTAGYFEWPHDTSGEEIAESMGVCRSTFHQHLRAAQRKVAAALFD
ncbi:PAS domain S-box protein [Halobellus sp. Atlit-38R]|uniref:PAS domain-containing protein n=1 Tax=Halobellus sp. Atlit-38R TaxID=2282131 RepID=UPI000EF20F77|nr:PAS domain-containing protein [Halobellus sp. Atlit-38R]RLM90708.1 PAS domain S-box protein [Halobellus sp. Atlit-38R]